ncbi:hypothetical protein BGZ92_005186 [Podila epicladia]|nr:hypothetical protein BGZ92_005186 [Podila epicladia]
MVVQGTVTGPNGQPYQQQIQVQGPFFMTSQRGQNGEELVMVPRRLLPQPNLNAHPQPTEPAMSQRKFEKSVKVEHEDDDGGAGVGASIDVAVVHQGTSSSENKGDEKKGDKV